MERGKSMNRKEWQRQSVMTVFCAVVCQYAAFATNIKRKTLYISHYCLLTEARSHDNYPLKVDLDTLISYT